MAVALDLPDTAEALTRYRARAGTWARIGPALLAGAVVITLVGRDHGLTWPEEMLPAVSGLALFLTGLGLGARRLARRMAHRLSRRPWTACAATSGAMGPGMRPGRMVLRDPVTGELWPLAVVAVQQRYELVAPGPAGVLWWCGDPRKGGVIAPPGGAELVWTRAVRGERARQRCVRVAEAQGLLERPVPRQPQPQAHPQPQAQAQAQQTRLQLQSQSQSQSQPQAQSQASVTEVAGAAGAGTGAGSGTATGSGTVTGSGLLAVLAPLRRRRRGGGVTGAGGAPGLPPGLSAGTPAAPAAPVGTGAPVAPAAPAPSGLPPRPAVSLAKPTDRPAPAPSPLPPTPDAPAVPITPVAPDTPVTFTYAVLAAEAHDAHISRPDPRRFRPFGPFRPDLDIRAVPWWRVRTLREVGAVSAVLQSFGGAAVIGALWWLFPEDTMPWMNLLIGGACTAAGLVALGRLVWRGVPTVHTLVRAALAPVPVPKRYVLLNDPYGAGPVLVLFPAYGGDGDEPEALLSVLPTGTARAPWLGMPAATGEAELRGWLDPSPAVVPWIGETALWPRHPYEEINPNDPEIRAYLEMLAPNATDPARQRPGTGGPTGSTGPASDGPASDGPA